MTFKTQSVLATVFSDDRKSVLLVKRRDIPVWVLPGGGIDKNETPEQAIIREVLEETGFTVEITRKVGEYTPINRISKFTHVFECKILKGSASTSSETKEVRFFATHNLPLKTPFPYIDWIKDALQTKFFQKNLYKITYFRLTRYLLSHPILVFRFFLSRMGLSINT
jgi:8-oxo-dGTP pyrophosphatase MutT (NUDIX family)